MRAAWILLSLLLCLGACEKPEAPPHGSGPTSPDVVDLAGPTPTMIFCDDVGLSPGMAFACRDVFGDGFPTPSQICARLGAGFKPPTSAALFDLAKLSTLNNFYFAAAYGTFNNANQLVSCSIQFGEPAIFGGGAALGRTGVKNAQPAPCMGWSKFYACQSGAPRCGAGPDLESSAALGDGWGVLCEKR